MISRDQTTVRRSDQTQVAKSVAQYLGLGIGRYMNDTTCTQIFMAVGWTNRNIFWGVAIASETIECNFLHGTRHCNMIFGNISLEGRGEFPRFDRKGFKITIVHLGSRDASVRDFHGQGEKKPVWTKIVIGWRIESENVILVFFANHPTLIVAKFGESFVSPRSHIFVVSRRNMFPSMFRFPPSVAVLQKLYTG